MFNKLVDWFKYKRFLTRNRFKVYAFTMCGKKYLTIKETGWRGIKWERRFLVAEELNGQFQPIPFDAKEAVKL